MKSNERKRRLAASIILAAACIVALMPTVPVEVAYTYTYTLPVHTYSVLDRTTYMETEYPNIYTIFIPLTTTTWTATGTETPISRVITTSTSYAPFLEVAANGQWSTVAVGAAVILTLLLGADLGLRFRRKTKQDKSP